MMKQKIICFALTIFCHSFCCFASDIQYIDTAQNLGTYVSKVAFGDLDNDGDLDIFVTHHDYRPNKVWLNDGSGNFSDSGQSLGSAFSVGIDLADLDGDGDLDAFVGNFFVNNNCDRVWLNDGSGNFSDSGQGLGGDNFSPPGDAWTTGIGLGDLDGDGDPDAFTATAMSNIIWFNDGSGNFSDSGQRLGPSPSNEVKLGDLDGDGDLDAFVSNVQYSPNKVWLNDGSGNFSDSGQNLGARCSTDAGLGDLDSDGDLDVFVANYDNEANTVWFNDGSGTFSDSGQRLGNSDSEGVSLGDLDNDGDLDAVVSNISSQANEIWLNDGSGNFSTSSHDLGNGSGMGFATIGDLDSNGMLDLALPAEDGSSIFLASVEEETCVNDTDCPPSELCIDDICQVPECAEDEDCGGGEYCNTDNGTCMEGLDCNLIIKKRRYSNHNNKKGDLPWRSYEIKVKGDPPFDAATAQTDFNFGEIEHGPSKLRKGGKQVKWRLQISTDLEPGLYPVRFGSCVDEIEIYNKRDKKKQL